MYQPAAAEDGLPNHIPHSPDVHVHIDKTAKLLLLGTGRRRLNGAAVASRKHARELQERRSDILLTAQYITWVWMSSQQ
jgi:hypothetical protein